MLLSQRHPVFYSISVWEKRVRRYVRWILQAGKYARRKGSELPVRVKSHQSVLIRQLGDSDIRLQIHKVQNLSIAAPCIDGVLIRPGETLSFWRLVGRTTARRGFKEGMVLSNGEVKSGVGGGLCQLANLLFWMALHSPLNVTERHHHSFDPFPDDGRVIPFGTGASVFYNYIDLELTNNTPYTFQFKVWLTDKHLKGELRSSEELPSSYHVFEKKQLFTIEEGRYYRSNEIWRNVIERITGKEVREEHLFSNHSLVKYMPSPDILDAAQSSTHG